MKMIGIESGRKLHAIAVMLIQKRWLKEVKRLHIFPFFYPEHKEMFIRLAYSI
jgi:hypothetical protein